MAVAGDDYPGLRFHGRIENAIVIRVGFDYFVVSSGIDKIERVAEQGNDGGYLLRGEPELGAQQNIFRFMEYVIRYAIAQLASRRQGKNPTCMSAKQDAGNEHIRIADNLHRVFGLRLRTLRMARSTSASVNCSWLVTVSPRLKTASHCL